jgi:hypothetical protein
MIRAMLLTALLALAPSPVSAEAAKKHCWTFPRDYVVSRPLSVKEVEEVELQRTLAMQRTLEDLPRLPFAFQNAQWTAFKSRMRKGDQLVEFSTDERSWQHLAGEAGYAILRAGCIVEKMTTILN